jgi:hypothetical protein
MLRLCRDVVLQMCSLSPSQREPFLTSARLGQGVILNRQVIASANRFYPQSSAQNFVIKFKTQIIIKFNFQSISLV